MTASQSRSTWQRQTRVCLAQGKVIGSGGVVPRLLGAVLIRPELEPLLFGGTLRLLGSVGGDGGTAGLGRVPRRVVGFVHEVGPGGGLPEGHEEHHLDCLLGWLWWEELLLCRGEEKRLLDDRLVLRSDC